MNDLEGCRSGKSSQMSISPTNTNKDTPANVITLNKCLLLSFFLINKEKYKLLLTS